MHSFPLSWQHLKGSSLCLYAHSLYFTIKAVMKSLHITCNVKSECMHSECNVHLEIAFGASLLVARLILLKGMNVFVESPSAIWVVTGSQSHSNQTTVTANNSCKLNRLFILKAFRCKQCKDSSEHFCKENRRNTDPGGTCKLLQYNQRLKTSWDTMTTDSKPTEENRHGIWLQTVVTIWWYM